MTETEANKIDPADGERFAQDLRRIREHRGVTLDQLHELTKIPLNILSDFEVNALLGNPLFNQVYLRSLVRTYAAQTNVDETRALECLESAFIGMYHGELGKEYLGDKPRRSRRKTKSGSKSDATRTATVEKTQEKEAVVNPSPDDPGPQIAKGISTVANQDAGGTASPNGFVLPRSSVFTAATSVAAVALLVAIAFFVWKSFSANPVEVANAGADTDAVELTTPRSLVPSESTTVATPVVPSPELGEKIELGVFAKGGNLRPIRIRVDGDLRRPYWIAQDSIRTFEFRNQIVLEENIGLVALSIEGFDFPLGLNPGDRVVISRDQVATFFESLPSR